MRKIILLLSLVFALPVVADTVDTKNLYFDGSNPVADLLLNTEKTRTEYRTVQEPATCYRNEYRRRCTQQPRTCRRVCNNGRCRTVCSDPRTVCRNVLVRIPYRCMRSFTRAVEVHDYYVDTRAQFNFDMSQVDGGAAENFELTVRGENESLSVRGSKNYLVLLNNKNKLERRNGDLKVIDLNYDISFASAKRINSVIGNGIKNVSLKNGMLRFELNKSFSAADFIQNLKVYRSRRLATDVLLFDRNLNQNEMDIQINGPVAAVSIDLASLGIQVPAKTRVILNTTFNTRGAEVLNANEIKTQASANWIFSK